MVDFAVLTYRPGDASAIAPLQAIQRQLARLTWSKVEARPGLEIWAPKVSDLRILLSSDGDALVLGKVFGNVEGAWRPDPRACARQFCHEIWGQYVAVFRQPAGPAIAMFRDPSAGVEALSWRAGGLRIVASDVTELLEAAPPSSLAIDWPLLGAALVDPIALAGACPLIGVAAATPGALRWLDGREEPIWEPWRFALEGRANTAETRAELTSAVDRVVSGLARPGGRAIAEVSGGLDSSIVASALVQSKATRVVEWIHYFVDDPGADERRYARATARHLGISLVEAPKATFGLGLDARQAPSNAIRPSGASADVHYDQDLASRCRQNGVDQIFTGLGGDTVFMQGGSPLIAADDYWRAPIWRSGLGPSLDVARASKRSVWSVWAGAQRSRFRPKPRPYRSETSHLTGVARKASQAQELHPWLRGWDAVAPAKRRQMMHLTYQLLVGGRTARGLEAEIVNPLLSQPVMEVCLSLSARALTHGGDDRYMARQAFSERLAPEIVARRSKGDLGRHYGRAIAEDLPAVRDLLFDGELAQAGLIDLERLEDLLTPETLIWKGPYREILDMVVLEQWARSWRRRLARLELGTDADRLVQPA